MYTSPGCLSGYQYSCPRLDLQNRPRPGWQRVLAQLAATNAAQKFLKFVGVVFHAALSSVSERGASARQDQRILLRMTSSKPTLYVFAISHYCEKARWALDYRGIDYELRSLAPGEHGQIARRLGAGKSSVPYLAIGEKVIQGSGDIINWAEALPAANGPRLTPEHDISAALNIEQRVDEIAGVHVRRFFYSEALVEQPSTVRSFFMRDLPWTKKIMIAVAWGKIRSLMIERMDLGRSQGSESQDILSQELDWLDELLADGREHLVGERFSRADLAVASLLSPLVVPAEHPTYAGIQIPPRATSTMQSWSEKTLHALGARYVLALSLADELTTIAD